MDLSALNSFDIGMIVFITFTTIIATYKGFTSTLLFFTNWILSTSLALWLRQDAYDVTLNVTSNQTLALIMSISGVFILSFVTLHFVSRSITVLLKRSGLSFFDRSLGCALGISLAYIISCSIFLLIVFFYGSVMQRQSLPNFLKEAKTYTLFNVSSQFLLDTLPNYTLTELEGMVSALTEKVPLLGANGSITSTLLPTHLTKEESALVNEMINSLDEQEVLALYESYFPNDTKSTDLEKGAFLYALINLYLQNNPPDINRPAIESLKKDLKTPDQLGSGYKPSQIEAIERLIYTVE